MESLNYNNIFDVPKQWILWASLSISRLSALFFESRTLNYSFLIQMEINKYHSLMKLLIEDQYLVSLELAAASRCPRKSYNSLLTFLWFISYEEVKINVSAIDGQPSEHWGLSIVMSMREEEKQETSQCFYVRNYLAVALTKQLIQQMFIPLG